MLKQALIIFSLLLSLSIHAQSITSRILDENKQPVPYASIQFGEFSGVISNEEGYFTIDEADLQSDSVIISCMGFTTVEISLQDLMLGNEIVLKEYVDELDEIYLSNSTPNPDEIIRKVNDHLDDNYEHQNIRYTVFSRNTSYVDFSRLNWKITKATAIRKNKLADVNSSLDSMMQTIKESKTIHFKDFLADFYLADKENAKLDVIKATRLIDQKKSLSVDQITDKVQDVFLRYLDPAQTYKLKTGIIKIEDSMSIDFNMGKLAKQDNYEYDVNNLKNQTHRLLLSSQNYDDTFLKQVLNPDLYRYSFQEVMYHQDELVYVILFRPDRAKAKYSGRLFITDENFAVVRADYQYAKGKRGEKFNLRLILGVKYVEDVRQGTMIFKKNAEGKYHPQYIKEEEGEYFYVKRPIKFIENSSEKKKLGFDFLIEGRAKEKTELLFNASTPISPVEFDELVEKEKIPYQNLKRYDPAIWTSNNALEPLKEMKEFEVSGDEN